jgi:ABC-type dipeptide/oligopeptide/nickel transport system ATPase component
MSFNFENDGIKIAKIKGDKKKHKYVYLDEKSEATNNYKELKLKDGEFQFIPDIKFRINYIVGASGSGKSYFASNLAEEYKLLYPKNPIYLLSYLSDDTSIDRVKGIKRILLNDDFLEETIECEDLKNSLTIWDDVDCITDKKMKLKLKELLIKILNTGRHTNTSLIYLSHIACNGVETKPLLNEASSITFFNQTLGGRTKNYLLNQYLGLNKKQIEAIDNISGRAITILKSYPMVVIAEKEIQLVKNLGKQQ